MKTESGKNKSSTASIQLSLKKNPVYKLKLKPFIHSLILCIIS